MLRVLASVQPSMEKSRTAVRVRSTRASIGLRPVRATLLAPILLLLLIAANLPVAGASGVETGPRLAWIQPWGSLEYDWVSDVAADTTGVYGVGDIDYIFVRKYAHDGSELWTRQIAGANMARGVVTDATGVYVGGLTDISLPDNVNAGGRDAYLRKYSHDGLELWTRQFGTPDDDQVTDVSINAAGVYVVGLWRSYDAFVRKYTHGGDFVWAREIPEYHYGKVPKIAASGTAVYVAGETSTRLPNATGNGSIFLIAYDTDGGELWSRQFYVTGSDMVWAISASADGVYLAGSVGGGGVLEPSSPGYVRKYDSNGQEAWTETESLFPEIPWGIGVADEGFYVAGESWARPSPCGEDGLVLRPFAFVALHSRDGPRIWTTPLCGLWHGWLSVAPHATGVYIGGFSFVAKLVVPGAAVGSTSVEFGEVETGTSATANMTIASTGTAPLTVTNVTLAGGIAGFSLPSPPALPLVVPSGSSVNVTVAFSPSSAGLAEDILRITTDDPAANLTEVALRGTGVPSATSRSLGGLLVWTGIVAGSVAAVAVVAYAVRRRRGTRRDAGGDDEAFHERTS